MNQKEEIMNAVKITIKADISAPIEKIWEYWSGPEHIKRWNYASNDWHCPSAENDLRSGGKFKSTMAAKDGSMSFDFEGVYDEVIHLKKIAYTMLDGRQAVVQFEQTKNLVCIITTFDAEDTNPIEMQEGGWQAILNNFKNYVETN